MPEKVALGEEVRVSVSLKANAVEKSSGKLAAGILLENFEVVMRFDGVPRAERERRAAEGVAGFVGRFLAEKPKGGAFEIPDSAFPDGARSVAESNVKEGDPPGKK